MLEHITFLLAIVGYAGLTITAVWAARGRLPTRLWRLAALVIVVHVVLVWTVRYDWQFAQATRNGYAGFLLFHGALALIMLSIVVGERLACMLVAVAFGVVSMGALGAVFRYDVVAAYQAPVIALAAAGTVGLARACWVARQRSVTAV